MDVLHTHCAGLDIHKDTVVACSRRVTAGKVIREVRTFKTTTSELLALSDWLGSLGATHIAMEATGVYWKPVWNILSDGDFELILANAAHVKNVPGRKTDVNDATWLADLLAHGLIRASFVPDTQTQEQRGLLRTRKQLTRERTSHIQRLQKTLEEANIKLELGDFRPHRRERTGHDRGLDRGRERSAAAGRPCKQPDQSLARHAWRGFARPCNAASSLSVTPPSSADRCVGPGHRRDRQGGRGQPRALSRVDPGPDQHSRHRGTGGPRSPR